MKLNGFISDIFTDAVDIVYSGLNPEHDSSGVNRAFEKMDQAVLSQYEREKAQKAKQQKTMNIALVGTVAVIGVFVLWPN